MIDPEKVPSEAEHIRKTYREAERDLIGLEGVENHGGRGSRVAT
jgi:hypothetical protein